MSWETTWLSQYDEARRRWYVDHPGQSDPSFWELNFSPGDQDITGAIRGVAEAIECHTGYHPLAAVLLFNWLQVSDTAEYSQVNHRVPQYLHPIVPLLDTFKTEQQPLKFVLPGKRPLDTQPQGVDGGVEEAFAPALRRLAVARILFDIRNEPRVENALPIVCGIKAPIEVEIRSAEVQPHLFGYLFQRFEALREQDHIRLIDGRHGDGR